MIHVGPGVEGGGSARLYLPPEASVLRRPAAEGRVAGPAEVTREPLERCKEHMTGQRSDPYIGSRTGTRPAGWRCDALKAKTKAKPRAVRDRKSVV